MPLYALLDRAKLAGAEQANTTSKAQRVDHECVEAGADGVDYHRLVQEFGSSLITEDDLARIAATSASPLHLFLRRGLFFSHRDLTALLTAHTRGEPFYIFTGRGPSASMHLGHLIPFHFAASLQRAFDVPVVIQISDDEKFFFKGISLEEAATFAAENIVDIIACGFDPRRTFIFKDTQTIGALYPMVCRIQNKLTVGQVSGAFGVKVTSSGGEATDTLGKLLYPAVQMAPAFAQGLPPELFSGSRVPPRCLVPMGIDQDPYFRLVRDLAKPLGQPKPAVIHNKFLPALGGLHTKMSASSGSAINLTDTPERVRKKMNRAFTGTRGDGSLTDHRRLGVDLERDVPIKFLQYFLEDDAELAHTEHAYAAGQVSCGEVKARAAAVVSEVLCRHQQARARVTANDVERFLAVRPLL